MAAGCDDAGIVPLAAIAFIGFGSKMVVDSWSSLR
jgi:hypothetical protein